MWQSHSKHFTGWWKAAALAMVLIAASFAHAAGSARMATQSVHATAPSADPHPIWPDNGIAQRKLPGGASMMFVERDKSGHWHAWAMDEGFEAPGVSLHHVSVLDFFSGKIQRARSYFEHGEQRASFTDEKSIERIAKPQAVQDEREDDLLPAGMTGSLEPLVLKGTDCSVALRSIEGAFTKRGEEGAGANWSKVPIARVQPNIFAPCAQGSISSDVTTTLDLQDGTVLMAMNCWVFRLRKADFSPVGSAPALRIVDRALVEAALQKAEGQNIQDASVYLSKALGLSFDAESACKAPL